MCERRWEKVSGEQCGERQSRGELRCGSWWHPVLRGSHLAALLSLPLCCVHLTPSSRSLCVVSQDLESEHSAMPRADLVEADLIEAQNVFASF